MQEFKSFINSFKWKTKKNKLYIQNYEKYACREEQIRT